MKLELLKIAAADAVARGFQSEPFELRCDEVRRFLLAWIPGAPSLKVITGKFDDDGAYDIGGDQIERGRIRLGGKGCERFGTGCGRIRGGNNRRHD